MEQFPEDSGEFVEKLKHAEFAKNPLQPLSGHRQNRPAERFYGCDPHHRKTNYFLKGIKMKITIYGKDNCSYCERAVALGKINHLKSHWISISIL